MYIDINVRDLLLPKKRKKVSTENRKGDILVKKSKTRSHKVCLRTRNTRSPSQTCEKKDNYVFQKKSAISPRARFSHVFTQKKRYADCHHSSQWHFLRSFVIEILPS